ncbi:MAG: c-type cytochrome, partial [Polyangiaceae bacterium]
AAVEGGKVVNEDEYAEQLSLLDEAGRMAARMAPTAPAGAPNLVESVAKVRALVDAKADASAVTGDIEPIRASTIAAFRLADSPSRAPDLARGQALWNEHCITCHGATGKGDTPRAATLTPRPTNFHDPEVGATMTPYRVANTVRFGVNGTAMVPFTFLSNEDRWDLAFLVVSLRHAEVGAADAGAPTYALGELAVRSDAQIAADLESAGVPPQAREAIVADLRRHAAYEDRAAARPLGLARARLDRARVAISRGERDAARGLIIDAYLEGVEPAELQLRAADPSWRGSSSSAS